MKFKLRLALLMAPWVAAGCTWVANDEPQGKDADITSAFINNISKDIDIQRTLFHMKCSNVYPNASSTPLTPIAGIAHTAQDVVQFGVSAQNLKLVQVTTDISSTGAQSKRAITCDVYLVQFATVAQTGLPALYYLPSDGTSYINMLHIGITPTLVNNDPAGADFTYDTPNKKSYKAKTSCSLVLPQFGGVCASVPPSRLSVSSLGFEKRGSPE